MPSSLSSETPLIFVMALAARQLADRRKHHDSNTPSLGLEMGQCRSLCCLLQKGVNMQLGYLRTQYPDIIDPVLIIVGKAYRQVVDPVEYVLATLMADFTIFCYERPEDFRSALQGVSVRQFCREEYDEAHPFFAMQRQLIQLLQAGNIVWT